MHREFSEEKPELMDLPGQDEKSLRSDLENIARLNRGFGGQKAVERVFEELADKSRGQVLIDIAAGYGDHGRNLLRLSETLGRELAVVAVDFQFQTLRIAREATSSSQKMYFVQADARRLPFRDNGADLAFCSLALHHFANEEAVIVLREMARVGRVGAACIDLARSRAALFCIWLLTTFVVRDPMVRHDGRVSARRAFSGAEMKSLAQRAGWSNLKQIKFFWFQQAVVARAPA